MTTVVVLQEPIGRMAGGTLRVLPHPVLGHAALVGGALRRARERGRPALHDGEKIGRCLVENLTTLALYTVCGLLTIKDCPCRRDSVP